MKTRSGKIKNSATAKNRFHYITRTSHFKNYKESASEQIEFVRSGNMPNFAEGKPAEFWQAADVFERSNGRTCSSLVVALPKELNQAQRIELAELFIREFADRYCYPFTCAIHHHVGSLGGQEQPHLHFMYSERHVDGLERTAEQFFKRYNPKDPQKGGAQKLTADVLGMGKSQLQLYRQKTEELINDSLKKYAPTKMVNIRGIEVEVPSLVSCLSNQDYNQKYGTQLQDVPMMNKAVRFARENEPELWAKRQEMVAEINRLRAENYYALYGPFYEAELERRKQIEVEKNRVETPRTREHDHAKAQLEMLQVRMQQTLRENPDFPKPLELIHADLNDYVTHLNTGHFERIEKLNYLGTLQSQLEHSTMYSTEVYQVLESLQQQVILGQLKLSVQPIKHAPTRNHDRGNDFSPGF
ncbi:MobA/MobL family protein [Acinetobacter bereziniae]|uniref:MobA/MobL family protein n=1 Tax=Acinetobacter bereziniae TaxID=106648 RepID=UPI002A0A6512|nr:MobA/MobL family protein [Acinetobacter bereziniae]